MATYEGKREERNAVVNVDGSSLPARHDLANHSPQGFEWAYQGGGPAQLALSILAHYFHNTGNCRELADKKALALYQEFKAKLVATLPKEGWRLDTHVVADTVDMIVREGAGRYFEHAMKLEVENECLSRDLSECYGLLEQEAGEGE